MITCTETELSDMVTKAIVQSINRDRAFALRVLKHILDSHRGIYDEFINKD